MSVEITKRGITKAEKSFKGSCFNCKTEIKCLGSDIKTYDASVGGMRDPRESNYDYVKCPVCENQITNLREIAPVSKWEVDTY